MVEANAGDPVEITKVEYEVTAHYCLGYAGFEAYFRKLDSDAACPGLPQYSDGRFNPRYPEVPLCPGKGVCPGLHYHPDYDYPAPPWEVQEGWTELVVDLIVYANDTSQPYDRFNVIFQVGQPDFVVEDAAVSPARPPVDEEVEITGTWRNAGGGRYCAYTEVDVFSLAKPQAPVCPPEPTLVWVGALAGQAGPGEAVHDEYTNDRSTDPFRDDRWMPADKGTYLLVFYAEADRAWRESDEKNNSLVVGLEVGTPDVPPVKTWHELVAQLQDPKRQSLLEINGSINEWAFDGLHRSFLTTGRGMGDDDYQDFLALVAFGRITAFDFTTSVIADLLAGEVERARKELTVFREYMESNKATIGDEVIVDFINTVQDRTPFNIGDDPDLIRGTTGNVALMAQALFAYQFITQKVGCPDARFHDYAQEILFGDDSRLGLIARQVDEPGSPLHGFFLSRPPGYFGPETGRKRFAIMENNLRMHDALGLAWAIANDPSYSSDWNEDSRERLRKSYASLNAALRRAFVDRCVEDYSEAVNDCGFVVNNFNSQDLYTLGGVFLLGEHEVEKAGQAFDYLNRHFICRHLPGSESAERVDLSRDPLPLPEGLGVSFFIGNDSSGNLIGRPIDFEDPLTMSHQTEATLDYILLAHWLGESEHFDLMADALVSLYGTLSEKGLMPASSRKIPGLFTTFESSLGVHEAVLVDLVQGGNDPQHVYRGFRPEDIDLSPRVMAFEVDQGKAIDLPELTFVFSDHMWASGEPLSVLDESSEPVPTHFELIGDGTETLTFRFTSPLPYGGPYTAVLRATGVTDSCGRDMPAGDYGVPLMIATPGDADLDGRVGYRDYICVKRNCGTDEAPGWGQADFTGDCTVGRPDLLLLREHFGEVFVPSPAGPTGALALASSHTGLSATDSTLAPPPEESGSSVTAAAAKPNAASMAALQLAWGEQAQQHDALAIPQHDALAHQTIDRTVDVLLRSAATLAVPKPNRWTAIADAEPRMPSPMSGEIEPEARLQHHLLASEALYVPCLSPLPPQQPATCISLKGGGLYRDQPLTKPNSHSLSVAAVERRPNNPKFSRPRGWQIRSLDGNTRAIRGRNGGFRSASALSRPAAADARTQALRRLGTFLVSQPRRWVLPPADAHLHPALPE